MKNANVRWKTTELQGADDKDLRWQEFLEALQKPKTASTRISSHWEEQADKISEGLANKRHLIFAESLQKIAGVRRAHYGTGEYY